MQTSIAAQETQASALAQLQADALIATTRTASEQPPPAQQAGGQLPQGDSSSHPPALMPPQAGIRVHRLPVWATSQQVITALANQDRLAAQDKGLWRGEGEPGFKGRQRIAASKIK